MAKTVEKFESKCKPFVETLELEFNRIAWMYSYYNPKPAVDAEAVMPIPQALKFYGIGNQAVNGDNP